MEIKAFFDKNEDVNILNTQYVKPFKNPLTGKWEDDYLYIVYRDNITKEKKLKTIKSPKTEIFMTSPEHRSEFRTQRLYLEKQQAESHLVSYKSIARHVCDEIKKDKRDMDLLRLINDVPKESFKWRHSYFSDYDINDYTMIAHALSNLNNGSVTNTNVTTAFLDIESDIYGKSSSEIDIGAAPVNAVSVVIPYDEYGKEYKHPKVFTLLLRNHLRYKDQKYFEDNLDDFINECHNEFDEKYNEPEFIIKLYDDEIVLFRNLFALLHKIKPDFVLIWNMSYDIPTMISRLTYLKQNPVNYFCHPDFTRPYYRYIYDNIYKNDFKNKTESFDCTSYSMYIDQMLNYAGIRKSRREYGGNSLDNVAKIELKSKKRRFNKPTTTVVNAAIEEYWNFVKYSINDVLLQYGIDKKTGDTQSLFEQSIYGGTRIYKSLKQSVYLKNVFAIEYFLSNIIPRNNKNLNNNIGEERSENNYDNISLAGALVANPILNKARGITMRIKKKHKKIWRIRSSNLFEFVIDFDFAAMYPNIKITNNIAENTQYFRIIIPSPVLADENPLNEEKFMRATKFVEDLESRDASLLGKWLHLPDIFSMINKYRKKSDDSFKRDKDGRIIISSRRRSS